MSKEKIFKTIENFGNKIRRINPFTIFDFLYPYKTEIDYFIISCYKSGHSIEKILSELKKDIDLYENLKEKIKNSREDVIRKYIERVITSYKQSND